ncbi:hypothetical protein ACO0LM_22985 [Undibacterium sp. Di26W]|uniref:hypothetical protein n=1 Tax=Undibacterium sp. Di26W TaxID=3413035 RepID=UPI003BF21387
MALALVARPTMAQAMLQTHSQMRHQITVAEMVVLYHSQIHQVTQFGAVAALQIKHLAGEVFSLVAAADLLVHMEVHPANMQLVHLLAAL